jgi:hypothetical protein
MYPLDAVYGPLAYRTFRKLGELKGKSLRLSGQKSLKIFDEKPLIVRSYSELVDLVSFFSVMNKRHTLYFRGQGKHLELLPTLFRSTWKSLSGTSHDIRSDAAALEKIYECLNNRISQIVLSVCLKFPIPRKATLRMFKESVWAIAQHYELWPTPLIDITPNLRAAASFALWNGRSEGNLYIVAIPPSTNSITFEADEHVVLARS